MNASGTEAAVCTDITARQQLGIKKYGQTVRENPLTLRQWLQHAYEESLDQAVYLKRSIEEIDSKDVYVPVNPDYIIPTYPQAWPEKLYVQNGSQTEPQPGFREFTGLGGHRVGDYAYPIYRKLP